MLKSLHRSLECITLAKEFNKLKQLTMKNLNHKKSNLEKSKIFWDLVDTLISQYNIQEYSAIEEAKESLGYLPKYSR